MAIRSLTKKKNSAIVVIMEKAPQGAFSIIT